MKTTVKQREQARAYYYKNRNDPQYRAKKEANRRLWRANHPEKRRAQYNRQNVNRKLRDRKITHSEFLDLQKRHEGSCAICGGTSVNGLHLDHNHVTNKVRGLLCCNCNLGLGNFRDDPKLLEKAIQYLGGVPCP